MLCLVGKTVLAGKPQLLHLVGAQTLHPSQAHRQQQPHVLGEALRALRGNGRDDVHMGGDQGRSPRTPPQRLQGTSGAGGLVGFGQLAVQLLPQLPPRDEDELHDLRTVHGGNVYGTIEGQGVVLTS